MLLAGGELDMGMIRGADSHLAVHPDGGESEGRLPDLALGYGKSVGWGITWA